MLINSIVPLYNNLIKSLKNESNSDKLISNQFVNNDEIIVLYNNGSPMNLTYREFLTNNKNISANLIGNNSINLKNSKKDLIELIESTTSVEPAKVVVIYDLLGNVINPGVKLSEDEKLSTTSDAIFDSSETIIDNILRTKLVPKDPKNVFYKKDENDTYHLVRNQVNKIYILNVDNNTFYFPTHYDLMNQLKKNLSLKAERIVYEK